MEKYLDLKKLQQGVDNIAAEEKVEILYDLICFYKDEPVATNDLLFLRRIAFKLNLDKSLIDLMLC